MFGLGHLELGIIGFIFMLLFGAKRLPELGRGMGGFIQSFRSGLKELPDIEEEIKRLDGEDVT